MNYTMPTLESSAAQFARIKRVEFTTMNQEEIKNYAPYNLTNPRVYQNGLPLPKGVNDLRLGAHTNASKCITCKQTKECPGHFGRIDLAQPVFHYGFMKHIIMVLKCICLNCSKLRIPQKNDKKVFQQIQNTKNNKYRLLSMSKLLQKVKKCGNVPSDEINNKDYKDYCGQKLPLKIEQENYKIKVKKPQDLIQSVEEKKKKSTNYSELFLSAADVYKILSKITKTQASVLGFKSSKPKNLVIKILLVAPPQVRPSIQMNPLNRSEDDLTTVYKNIIAINNEILQGKWNSIKQQSYVLGLQVLVNSLINRKRAKKSYDKAQGLKVNIKDISKTVKSITDRLKGKQGRFRQNLMGKRVDFSARSVISPDSNLALDQLGVPQKIARSLTFPQEITSLNINRIIELCKQGKVLFLFRQTQNKQKYEPFCSSMFQKIEVIEKQLNYGMIAQRCLQDGDYVLFNRQPTLHRMSMMCHRIKILPHSTFRLNLSVCTPYNADFDGDQMNLHVPQSYETISQLKHITHVPKQIVTPKNNSPVMGIVQDALLGIYIFTLRDTFLTKEQVMNLVVWIEDFSGDFPMPAIIKPQPLWTGKQVMSLIIPKQISIYNIKDPNQRNTKDISLIIRKGELLTGALQKQLVGPGAGGLIHTLWLQKTPQETSKFMTTAQRIVNNFLISYGFSCGASDCVPSLKCKQRIKQARELIQKSFNESYDMFFSEQQIQSKNLHNKNKKIMDSLQFKINEHLNKGLNIGKNIIQETISPYKNSLYKMIWAKSKGNQTNLLQILGMLGNQNVDGKRLPQGFKNRSSCHFPKDDFSPQPRGFIFSSFQKGLKAHQLFFHSMSGRQGLSDTAVKTSRTGYIQRKLIKALQDVIVKYDGTVRDSQNNMIQRHYGEDGIAGQYIQKQKIPALQMSNQVFKAQFKWSEFQELQKFENGNKKPSISPLHQSVHKQLQKNLIENLEWLDYQFELLQKARKKLRDIFVKERKKDIYCPIKLQRLIMNKRIQKNVSVNQPCYLNPVTVFQRTQQTLQQIIPNFYQEQYQKLKINFKQYSELIQPQKKEYIKKLQMFQKQSGTQLFRIHIRLGLASKLVCSKYRLTQEVFCQILDQIKSKYHQSIIQPGETIGAIAAQSVGQPTTQMTLNTFHLAGVSQNNVTLGVPRMQQLLDASKKMKTPSLKIYLNKVYDLTIKQDYHQLFNLILNRIPERFIGYYIIGSKIYYDPDPSQSYFFKQFKVDTDVNIDIFNEMTQKFTPWVLFLKFDKSKVVNVDMWKEITASILKISEHQCLMNSSPYFDEILWIKIRMNSNQQEQAQFYFKVLKKIDIQIRRHRLGMGIKGIKKVFKKQQKIFKANQFGQLKQEGSLILQTQGSNLRQILCQDYVDYRKTYSNDIIEVLSVLGIEAARQAFLNEFRTVLQPYNIYINLRHIITLSDWMTRRGKLTPINRNGINRISDVSVLRKASFEQTVQVLYDAAITQQIDNMKGISETIIFGQNCNIGTGYFQLILNRKNVNQAKKIPQKDSKIYDTAEKQFYEDGKRMIDFQYSRTPIIGQTPNVFDSTIRSPNPQYFDKFTPNLQHSIRQEQYFSPKMPLPSPYYPALQLSASSRQQSPGSQSKPFVHGRSTPAYIRSTSPVSNYEGGSSQHYLSSSPSYQSHLSQQTANYDSIYEQGSPGYGNSSRRQTPYHATIAQQDD